MPQNGRSSAEKVEKVDEFIAYLKTLPNPFSWHPFQEGALREQCFKLLSAPGAVPTKTARRRVCPPRWASDLADLFNLVENKLPIDPLIIHFGEYWLTLPSERDKERYNLITDHATCMKEMSQATGIPMSALAAMLFWWGLAYLSHFSWGRVEEFIAAWGSGSSMPAFLEHPEDAAIAAITCDYLSEKVQSRDWGLRFRRCLAPWCGQWFLDRSPRWRTVPARFCCARHRARTFKARRKASHASS